MKALVCAGLGAWTNIAGLCEVLAGSGIEAALMGSERDLDEAGELPFRTIRVPVGAQHETFVSGRPPAERFAALFDLIRRSHSFTLDLLAAESFDFGVLHAYGTCAGQAIAFESRGLPWLTFAASPGALDPALLEKPKIWDPHSKWDDWMAAVNSPLQGNQIAVSRSRRGVLCAWSERFRTGIEPSNAVLLGPLSWSGREPVAPPAVAAWRSGPSPRLLVTTGSYVSPKAEPVERAYLTAAARAARSLGLNALFVLSGPIRALKEVGEEGLLEVNRFPHDALAPSADLWLSHGGAGAIGKAAALGLPMVIVPGGIEKADTDVNARSAQRAGLATVVEPTEAALAGFSELLRDALSRLPQLRARAAEVASEIAEVRRGANARRLVEALLQ